MFFLGKLRSHDIFFSWTFDLLLINSRYLVFVVYFSPHQRNIVCEYKLHGKPIMKYQSWTCLWYWCWKNLFFNVKLKLLMNKFWFFSVSWAHFQKQPFVEVLQNRCSWKFRNKKRLQHRCFLVRSTHVMIIYWYISFSKCWESDFMP